MSKKLKAVLCACAAFIVIGAILCTVSCVFGFKGNFGITTDLKYVDFNAEETVLNKTPLEAFTSISVEDIEGDIELAASDGYAIEYTGMSEFSYSIEDGVLKVSSRAKRDNGYLLAVGKSPWIFNAGIITSGIGYGSRVKLYYPKELALDSVSISSSLGDISVSGIKTGMLSLNAEAGDIILDNASAENTSVVNGLGDVTVNSLSGGSCTVELSAGDAELRNLNLGGNLTADNRLGDIMLQGVSAASISADVSGGDIEMVSFMSAGNISLKNQYGDIELSHPIDGLGSYSFDLSTDLGEIEYREREMGSSAFIDNGAAKTVTAKNSCGDIDVE